MFLPKFSLIFIFIQIFYPFQLPNGIQARKNNAGPKLANQPLVLFKSENSKYTFPRCYRQDSKGKIRDFKATNGPEPMFFCPNPAPESNGKFLYLTTDNEYSCKIAPQPTIRKVSNRCAGTGDLYSYGYNISEKPFDKEHTSDHWQEIYSFCYVKEENQVVYLSYRIFSPNLLMNKQLYRERSYHEKKYRLEEFEDESLKAYIKVLIDFNSVQSRNTLYTKAELGYPDDMIFPIWKKPFYHAANQGLILQVIKNQWKKIGTYVKRLAEKKLGEVDIITGTLKYPDGKLFGTWWKLVIHKNHAMVIILHNVYFHSLKNDPRTQPSEMYPTDYELLCPNICKENGFHGLSTSPKVIMYCCNPIVITEPLGLPTYEILNLKQTPRDTSVVDDGCPKDPIEASTSEDDENSFEEFFVDMRFYEN